MMYNNYANHSMCGLSLKHNSLPILAQTEFDFCRYVTFTDDMYGKTVSELHRGNLRTVNDTNRYADLFGGNKVSYWAATRQIASREWRKHNPNKTNHLVFYAYDDMSSTFPTIRCEEPLIIIDGIKLGFEKILEKYDRKEPLTEQDKLLIEEIKSVNPDCLAYKPHTSKENPPEWLPVTYEPNFMFFEKGFKKLSLKKVELRLNHHRNRNDIFCITDSDYNPDEEAYGKCFLPAARVGIDMDYLKSEEYLSRKDTCEQIWKEKSENMRKEVL